MGGNDVVVKEPGLPGLIDGGEALALAKAFTAAIMDDGGYDNLTLPRLPTREEHKTLTEGLRLARIKYRAIQESMTDRDKAGAAFARLFSGFFSMAKHDVDEATATYNAFMFDLSLPAIEAAVDDFRRKAVKGWDPAWPPTAPMFHGIAAAHQQRMYAAHILPFERTLSVKKIARPRNTPEQDRIVQPKLKALAEELGTFDDPETSAMKARTRQRSIDASRDSIEREWRALGLEPPKRQLYGVSLARLMGDERVLQADAELRERQERGF